MSSSLRVSISVAALLFVDAASADPLHNGYTYSSAAACAAAGRYPGSVCGYSERNAAAEFEEKAPRFAARAACEQALRQPCAIGFRGAGGWSGRKDSVYFTARQQGFRLDGTPGRDVKVTPIAGSLTFSARSALRLDVAISPQAPRYWNAAATPLRPGLTGQGPSFGVSNPEGPKGETPPRPPIDPNFDCAAVLEPSAGSDPNTGCAPVPLRRR
jgi:hypothetical protein